MLSGIMSDMTVSELGRMGGKARAVALSKAERSEIARQGAAERWKNHTRKTKPRKPKKTS